MTKIMLTGVGAPGAPDIIGCFRQSLDDLVLLGTDIRDDFAGRFLLDTFIKTHRRDSPKFIAEIILLCEQHSVDVVYPLPTLDLPVFAAARKHFADNGISLVVPDASAIKLSNNKLHLYNFLLKEARELCLRFKLVDTVKNLFEALEEFGYPEQAVCVRQAVSTGGQGFCIIDPNVDEFEKFLGPVPSIRRYSLTSFKAIFQQSLTFEPMIVQEYASGEEWDVDTLSKEGSMLFACTRKNISMNRGLSTHCTIEHNPELVGLCKVLIDKLGLSFVSSLTFKYDSENQPKLLEINPRMPASVASSLVHNVNLPLAAVRLAQGSRFVAPSELFSGDYFRFLTSAVVSSENEVRIILNSKGKSSR
jgi:carbamoyl-phosphate synthase large subunit